MTDHPAPSAPPTWFAFCDELFPNSRHMTADESKEFDAIVTKQSHPNPPPSLAEMAAARELDVLVAQKVMGWRWVTFDGEDREWLSSCSVGREQPSHPQQRWGDGSKRRDSDTVPRYSTRIEDAWLVVEKMRERGLMFGVDDLGVEGEEWRVWFANAKQKHWHGDADETPLAICRAALAAVGDT